MDAIMLRTIRQAEDYEEEWAVIVISHDGRRQYLGPDQTFTRFRGNSVRLNGQAAALERAYQLRTLTRRPGGTHLVFPWIADTEVELIKTRRR